MRLAVLLYLFFSVTVFAQDQASAPAAHPADAPPSLSTMVSSARVQGFTITSKNLDRDLENDTISLSGDVKVIYQNQYFEADQVDINFKKKQAILKGKVKIQTPTYQIGGQQITLDYESNQGIIYIGYVQSNNIRFQGDMIEKMSDTQFYVTDAEYTSCSNCPATWSFEGSKIRAELGGYAYIKSSFLKVGEVPVFWLPYLVVPLKSERQTGLLAPEFGFVQKRNLFISQDLFWAISRSQDATITMKNYELGGLKPAIEYRYAVADDSFGFLKVSFIRDTVFSSDERYTKYTPPEDKEKILNRWGLRSYNQYFLSSVDKVQLQLNLTSDLQYPKDFYDEFRNYTDPSLENRLTYSHFFDHALISLDGSYYKNLLQANPIGNNDASVHRLPEIRFDSTYKKVFDSPFLYKVESSWTNFYRKKYYDDISTSNGQNYVSNNQNNPDCERFNKSPQCLLVEDGVYNEGTDILRAGQRLTLKSSLTTEAFNPTNFLNLTPTFSYNESLYLFQTEKDKSASVRYAKFDLNTRTKFYDIYDKNSATTGNKYKNEIIPEIRYSWIPWIEQESNPFFGNNNAFELPYSSQSIGDSDVNTRGGVLFDYEDRLYDRHIVSVSLLDRLVRKKLADNVYKTLVNFRVVQSYDLYQSQFGKNKDQPLSDLTATLTLDLDQVQSYTQMNYSPYKSATNTTTSLSYLNDKQQYFRVGWISKRIDDPKQDDLSLSLGFVSSYVNVLTGFIFDASDNRDSASRLKKFSIITQLKPPGDCWAINFYREQKIAADAEWRVRFDFSFDGKPTKVIPPAELNIN